MTRTAVLFAVLLALGFASLVSLTRLFLMAVRRYRVSSDLRALAVWSFLMIAIVPAALAIRSFRAADIFLLFLLAAQTGARIWIDRSDSRDELVRYRRSLRQL